MPYAINFHGGTIMSGISKAVSDELFIQAQISLKELGKTGDISRKLQAIIAAKKFGVSLAAKVFDTSRPSIMAWIKNFKQDAQDGLAIKSGRGRKPAVNSEIKEVSAKFMQQNPNATIKELKCFIEENQNITISVSSVNRLMRQLGLSYITPRPIHHKADLLEGEKFKKNSKKSPKNHQKKSSFSLMNQDSEHIQN